MSQSDNGTLVQSTRPLTRDLESDNDLPYRVTDSPTQLET